MPSKPPTNYTAAEVADILRISVYYARELCAAKKIPGAHKPAGQWLIDVKTFDAWRNEAMRENQVVPEAAAS